MSKDLILKLCSHHQQQTMAHIMTPGDCPLCLPQLVKPQAVQCEEMAGTLERWAWATGNPQAAQHFRAAAVSCLLAQQALDDADLKAELEQDHK